MIISIKCAPFALPCIEELNEGKQRFLDAENLQYIGKNFFLNGIVPLKFFRPDYRYKPTRPQR